MRQISIKALTNALPMAVASALLLSACGGGAGAQAVVQPKVVAPAAPAPQSPAAPDPAKVAAAPMAQLSASLPGSAARVPTAGGRTFAPAPGHPAVTTAKRTASADEQAANQRAYDQSNGATDIGVSRTEIKLGSINMHGIALGNILIAPQVRGNLATASAINDRGGVLGRRLNIADCDDGPGEVSRGKACLKKLVGQDKIFSMITGVDWATASIHDDLKQYQLPYVGAWAYSQTEWQDPYMFPAHMSMIHEAMAGAHWAANVVKPQTYGLVCLTSPEMQLACGQVEKIMDASGAKLVKKADVAISETSMSAYVLAMRAANPEHIIHYVINPSTMAKFMVESAQQGYYPPKGISGNHLAAEVLGSIFGNWPTGRYWTNTTYKLWGPEFIATVTKYARGNRGENHHIVQAGYMAVNMFAHAAKQVGPNLTRPRLMAVLGNGTVWASDASMDQRFSYVPSERYGDNWNANYGQGREFMYKYTSTNTVSNPDGSPNGFQPDPDQFVIYTSK